MRGTATRKGQKNRRLTKEERLAIVRKQRIIAGAIAAVVILYLAVSVRYLFYFESRSYVNGVNVSGMSLRESKEALQHVADTYSLKIKGPLGSSEVIDGSGLSMQVADASDAKTALKKQSALGWIIGNLIHSSYSVDLIMQYDEPALEAKIDTLQMLDTDRMTAPVDASLHVTETGTCQIASEQYGTLLDVDKAKEAIRTAVSEGRPEVDISVYAAVPNVYSGDQSLNKRMNQWNYLLRAAGLTYRVDGHDITLDSKAIANLLTDDGTMVTLSREKVIMLVNQWKSDYDTYSKSFDFTTYNGDTIRIDPLGDYGYALNDEETVDDICRRIPAGDNGSYELTYWNKPLYDTNNGLGGSYVEVSLREQHLWLWKDGKVILDTAVVTGLPVHGRITYMGCFSIKKKMKDVVLGDVQKEGYESPVSYWVPFNGGEGLHDANWRDEFGGNIWKYSGSHGCVNCPPSVMPMIFDNVEIGEAVVIYGDPYDESVYTGETTSEAED